MSRQSPSGRQLAWLAARRPLLTALTAILLTGCYVAYARVTRPLLRVALAPAPALPRQSAWREPPPALVETAKTYLPRETWIRHAKYQFRRGNDFLFFNKRVTAEDGHALELQPLAMILRSESEDGRRPVTIVCREARLKFDRKVTVSDFDTSRLTGGSLRGLVRVKGADDLIIEGHNFQFSQDMRVWSDHDVKFRVDHHWGTAHGVDIKLRNDPERPEGGLFSAVDVKDLRLRNDVLLHLRLEDRADSSKAASGAGGPAGHVPEAARIRSRGSFEFDFVTKIAEFRRDVRRQTRHGRLDSLNCDQFRIQFTDREDRSDDEPPDGRREFLRLRPQHLTAAGRNCQLQSDENDLRAHMAHMSWNLDSGRLVLTGIPGAAAVRVYQRDRSLVSERVELLHNRRGRDIEVNCAGRGWFQQRSPESEDIRYFASWQDQFELRNDPETGLDVLELVGEAVVEQRLTDPFRLQAGRMRVWLERSTTSAAEAATTSDDYQERLHARRLEAHNAVTLHSPKLQSFPGSPTDHLVVDFSQADPARVLPNMAGGEVPYDPSVAQDSEGGPPEVAEQPLQFAASRIQIRFQNRESEQGLEPEEVWMTGSVRVAQRQHAGQEPVHLSGHSLHLIQRGPKDRFFTMRGIPNQQPAGILGDGRLIEGEHLTFEVERNLAAVIGRGHIQWLVARDLENNRLPGPQPLDVTWKDGMTFDGTTATLIGDVTAVLRDGATQVQQLTCGRMRVHFTKRLAGDDAPQADQVSDTADDLRVEAVECDGVVVVRSGEYLEGRLMAERRASMYDVRLDQHTGQLIGQGPGHILSWRPDEGRRAALSPVATVRANEPLLSQFGNWEYVRIDFLGELQASTQRRTTTFEDDVRIVYGLVPRLGATIDPGSVSRLPRDAGIMDCDELTLTHHQATESTREYSDLAGRGNVRLEGNRFRAQADQVSFDGSKEQFILRSDPESVALIWRQRALGSDPQPSSGRNFLFIPKDDALYRLRGEGITSIQGQQ